MVAVNFVLQQPLSYYPSLLLLLFLGPGLICSCCWHRRSRDDPLQTVANSAPATFVAMSQHQPADEISVTVYAKDATDDGGNDSESCAICLEDFAAGEEVRVLPRCKHAFHKGCVDPWLLSRSKSTCPLCRDPVVVARPTSDGDYDRDSHDDEADDDYDDEDFSIVDTLMSLRSVYSDDERFDIDDYIDDD